MKTTEQRIFTILEGLQLSTPNGMKNYGHIHVESTGETGISIVKWGLNYDTKKFDFKNIEEAEAFFSSDNREILFRKFSL